MTNYPGPTVHHWADRLTHSLREIPENVHSLMSLISPEVAELLDFDNAVRVPGTFIREDLQKKEADIAYQMPLKATQADAELQEVLVYVLLEQQTKPDPTIPLRLLSYMVELWMVEYRKWSAQASPGPLRLLPIIPIVFYTGARNWEIPRTLNGLMKLTGELECFVPSWETLHLNLQQTDDAVLRKAHTAIAELLRAWKTAAEPEEELSAILADVADRLDGYQREEWRRTMLALYLLIQHTRGSGEASALFALLAAHTRRNAEELETIMITAADELREELRGEFREEVRGEVREEERAVGKREVIARLVVRKFGLTAADAKKMLLGVADDRLDDIADGLIVANSLSELGL